MEHLEQCSYGVETAGEGRVRGRKGLLEHPLLNKDLEETGREDVHILREELQRRTKGVLRYRAVWSLACQSASRRAR